jgi:BON domain
MRGQFAMESRSSPKSERQTLRYKNRRHAAAQSDNGCPIRKYQFLGIDHSCYETSGCAALSSTTIEEIKLNNRRQFHALAASIVLSGLLAGCAAQRKCEAGGCPADAGITDHVQSKLNQHPEFGPPYAVRVQTLDQVVYLSGEVSDGLMKRTAEDVARYTPGVTRVVNDISVTK